VPTIIVADDDKFFRDEISNYFLSRYYTVKTVSHGGDIVPEVVNSRCDVLVLDVYMDGIDGLQALPLINRARPDLPVIVITGDTSLETERKVRAHNVYYYLNKPFTMQEIDEAVRTAIEKKSRRG
jgi:two-component system nitrogen regulation response regulator GlnG